MDGGLHVRVDTLENQFKDFRKDISQRFDSVSEEIKEGLAAVGRQFETIGQTREAGLGRQLTIAAAIVSVLLAFGGYVKSNIESSLHDNRDATDKVDVALAKFIDKTGDRFDRLTDKTIPKDELNSRLADLKAVQAGKVDKDVFAENVKYRDDQIDSLRTDIASLKAALVSRDDIQSRFHEYQDRLTLISNRLTEVAKSTEGFGIVADNLRQLRNQVDDFQRKFITVPAFPKYNDK